MHRIAKQLCLTVMVWAGLSLPAEAEEKEGPKIEKIMQAAPEIPANVTWHGNLPKRPTLANNKGNVVILHFWSIDEPNSEINFDIFLRWRNAYERDGLRIVSFHVPPGPRKFTPSEWEGFPKHVQQEYLNQAKTDNEGAKKRAQALADVFPTFFGENFDYLRSFGAKDAKIPAGPNGQSQILIHATPELPQLIMIDRRGQARYRVEGVMQYKRKDYSKPVVEKLEALLGEKK